MDPVVTMPKPGRSDCWVAESLEDEYIGQMKNRKQVITENCKPESAWSCKNSFLERRIYRSMKIRIYRFARSGIEGGTKAAA